MTKDEALAILANSQHFPEARDLIKEAWQVATGQSAEVIRFPGQSDVPCDVEPWNGDAA